MITQTRKKINEAEYFLAQTEVQFKNQSLDFEYSLNAFVNAARNVTFVLQKEFRHKDGFNEWYDAQPIKSDETAMNFVHLRDVSVKEKTVGHDIFTIKGDFGPDGLHVEGHKGPTSVKSDPIRFDEPIPEYSYVTVKDDNGERRVKYKITHDFNIVETYDHGTKKVEFVGFLSEARGYLAKLNALVTEAEEKFNSIAK